MIGAHAVAALLPAFSLAAAGCGLFAAVLPFGLEARLTVAVMLFLPAWLGAGLWAFAFATARRAWLVLLVANALAFAALAGVKTLGWLGPL